MAELSALEYLLRRDRLIVAVGLAAVVALAWIYLATGAGMDTSMADMAMDISMSHARSCCHLATDSAAPPVSA